MSNSKYVDYTLISPNKTAPRNKPISKIVIHHMAGNLTVEQCGKVFQPKTRKASSNYGIGSDGRVGLYVEECDRSWASSNATVDNCAVSIEVADASNKPAWTVTDKAFNKLIDLCVDICQRNGIKELKWTGDKNGSLVVHRFYKATECPSDYLMNKMPELAQSVNAKLKPQTAQNEPKKAQTTNVSTVANKSLESAKSKENGHSKGTTLTVIAKNGLNIRLGAAATKLLAGAPIPNGASVKWYGYYTETNGKRWLLVNYKGIDGYCLADYLK